MDRLSSIQRADKKFTTSGSQPIRVVASDVESYICKYPTSIGNVKLVNELIGYQFALCWGINTPEMAFIDVSRDHLPEEYLGGGLSYVSIEKPLIGSKVIPNAIDVADRLLDEMGSSDLKKFNKKELINIALFDIWLSNDDRNHNNCNLLIKEQKGIRNLYAIDHEAIFNSSDLSRGIFELSYEDSLIYSGVFHKLIKKSSPNIQLIKEIDTSLHEKVNACYDQLDDILNLIPDEWNVNTADLKNRLHQNIFSNNWLKSVSGTFNEFASLTL